MERLFKGTTEVKEDITNPKSNTKKPTQSLLHKIRAFADFNPSKSSLKEPTQPYVVHKPMKQPRMTCVTDRKLMQRLVNKYLTVLEGRNNDDIVAALN